MPPLARTARALVWLPLLLLVLGLPIPSGRPAEAQMGEPPHLFFGSAEDGAPALLDGAPAPDGTIVQAINEAGLTVAEATLADGIWSFIVDVADAASITIWLDGVFGAGPFDVVGGFLTKAPLNAISGVGPPPAPVLKSIEIVVGFNVLPYLEQVVTPIADWAADFSAVYGFDVGSQTWRVYRPDGPALLNTLDTLLPGEPYFVLASAAAFVGLSGDPASIPEPLQLQPGLNFVTFAGADGTAIADLLAPFPALSQAFRWDAQGQRWQSYAAAIPASLQDFQTVDAFDALFIRNSSAVAVTLPVTGP